MATITDCPTRQILSPQSSLRSSLWHRFLRCEILRGRATSLILAHGLALILGVAFLAGCDSAPNRQQSTEELKARWSALEGAKNSDDPAVRSEITSVLDSGGGPQQLIRPLPAPEDNVAVGLAELVNSGREESLRRRVEELMPNDLIEFNPVRMQKVIRLVKDESDLLKAIDEATSRKTCHFAIDYAWGFSANTDVLDLAVLCVKLKALEVAAQLKEDQPATAAYPLSKMFRIIGLLASEPHADFRLVAAQQRELAFRALDKISSHPETTRDVLISLHAQVTAQLNSWPSDAAAWTGDRAMSLQSYEMIRDGQVNLLLTEEEVEQFSREGVLLALPQALKRSADNDELYYLLAMRNILESCKQPYFQRKKLFESIRKELHEKREAEDFPFAAARLFLSDIEEGHRLQAVDRRRAETWAIALAAAAGIAPPAYQQDPVTGEAYALQHQQTRVSVRVTSTEGGEIVVPHPKPVSLSSRPDRER